MCFKGAIEVCSALTRGVEASAQLSLLLTVGNMIFPVVNRGFGLALAEIDEMRCRYGDDSAKPSKPISEGAQ